MVAGLAIIPIGPCARISNEGVGDPPGPILVSQRWQTISYVVIPIGALVALGAGIGLVFIDRQLGSKEPVRAPTATEEFPVALTLAASAKILPELQPLKFPKPWPPPDRAQGELARIPILGWLMMGIAETVEMLTRNAYWKLQFDIEAQILRQLAARYDLQVTWPTDAVQKRVVTALSAAVCDEKGLDRLVLHPHDPAILLLWGPYDDLTPELFRRELEWEFHTKIATTSFYDVLWASDVEGKRSYHHILKSQTTVKEIVERTVAFVARTTTVG